MTFPDFDEYVKTREQAYADYEKQRRMGTEDACEYCKSRIFLF